MEKCRKCGIWHNMPKCTCENPNVMSEDDGGFVSSPIHIPFSENMNIPDENISIGEGNFSGGGSSEDF